MIGDYKIVDFLKYCPQCKHRDEPETSEACSACLEEPARIDSHKPEKFEFAEDFKEYDYKSLIKLEDYLYEIRYRALDYEFAKLYFKTHNPLDRPVGCSCIRKGNFYGRNYDWYYDKHPSFITYVPAIGKNHASLSICQGFDEIDNRFAESGAYTDLYKILPFVVLDGINDSGLVCNTNVVPVGDWGATTGTTPAIAKREELSIFMLLRYILDKFGDATTAVNYIRDYISVYSYEGFEAHFMIADSVNTYILEFINNAVDIMDVTNGRPYMTNFYIKNSRFNANTGKVIRTSLTPYGSGVERYELIAANYDSINSVDDMINFMHKKLKYTNAYDPNVSPYWFTEFVGGSLTVTSPDSAFANIVATAQSRFKSRTREDGNTWQSVHSVTYDISNRIMYVIPQETGRMHIASLKFPG